MWGGGGGIGVCRWKGSVERDENRIRGTQIVIICGASICNTLDRVD